MHRLHTPPPTLIVNDVHSRLNACPIAGLVAVDSADALQRAVRQAAATHLPVSIAGGRHAMGGQQFVRDGMLLDFRRFNRLLALDADSGLVTVEAGIDWPTLYDRLRAEQRDEPFRWSVVQKQTGADRLTIGGALGANIHGRGLTLPPIVAQVEAFTLVDAQGDLVSCSRRERPDLFRLAIGGYGLFGPMASVTLRLQRRYKLARRVEVRDLAGLADAFAARVAAGFTYGDFQFATDATSDAFLHRGVFACYEPVPDDTPVPGWQHQLTEHDWQRLTWLAHHDKARAFDLYAAHYLASDGQIYWSDEHQLAFYEDGYHERLDREGGRTCPGSEMITEIYVPRARLERFMDRAARELRRAQANVVYGTIRLVERDEDTLLAWAREPWACIVFNLHIDHTPEDVARAADTLRLLIDLGLAEEGSYYLTYHRWATAAQLRGAHPRIGEFLEAKRRLDPDGRFSSNWFQHVAALVD